MMKTGPRDAPPPDAKPLDYILLFLTLDFLASVVTHTNNNATAFIDNNRDNIRPKSIVHRLLQMLTSKTTWWSQKGPYSLQ